MLEGARRGLFDVVAGEALDRVSRDQADVAIFYKHLCFADVKLVTLAESEINELHVGLKLLEISAQFVGMLRPAGADFEPGHIKAELGHKDSRPDLTVHDEDGRVWAFIENKFWTELTGAQPVSYLEALPDDPPAFLLLILSRPRIEVAERVPRRTRDRSGGTWRREAPLNPPPGGLTAHMRTDIYRHERACEWVPLYKTGSHDNLSSEIVLSHKIGRNMSWEKNNLGSLSSQSLPTKPKQTQAYGHGSRNLFAPQQEPRVNHENSHPS